MERRVLLAAILIILQLLLVALITPSSSTVERADHWCGQYSDLTWAICNPGRCCGLNYYCGHGDNYCAPDYCRFQCHMAPPLPPPPPPGGGYDQSNNYEAGGVLLTRLVNATHNLDNASSSSSSSSSSSLLSCTRSLSRLPLASRYKYPFAALRGPRPRNNITTTRCGRCLKVTNLGVGELHRQVKVRIAHEHGNEGLGLDLNIFKQLDTGGSGITKGHILVKYKFESC